MTSHGGINALKQVNAKGKTFLLVALAVVLNGCTTSSSEPSWAIYPLQRHQAHDGLAVVSEPDGYGVHLFLETDTSDPAICTPRW
ncbi:MAG TPA: hypothetical protein QF700_04935, partial [Prochlorococcus sp.]|nr:hypothetical protein [Prochlorococcus sp.]